MGKRSKLVIVTAGSAAFAVRTLSSARRRARFAESVKGFAEAIMPSVVRGTPSAQSQAVVDDESHAPGHRHLPRKEKVAAEPRPVFERPFAKHQHGLRHPGRR
jgi:hypothetical protein